MIKKYLKYIQDNPNKYWFKRKLYGWGWTPATWQGWAITCLYIIFIFIFALTIDANSPLSEVFFTFILPVTLITIFFIRIAYKKGESPKWMWGLPKE
ncbi:hypothetical protein COW81_03520 [Candidatus Campbellbacteria bacterium CG22_combo_CG10-13_8_21_14_all_36_13]|uniref:Uncharacterized protein n=1 Tax=Candidatus Campbellbacteria bacterium CG22_combo_CG10-13_8_21_14_all_36_13 TaxID=1974529 RepID=A0A2H0DXB7_9BACT|nr:MAG: hypothetical protein COW81_03520 [Candidatus Campbellbacteria bacterium CG22_combo_CG10-13_8_21_14_all_36_13]